MLNQVQFVQLSPRTDVRRRVRCPSCGARAGQHCIGARNKVRESNHAERVLLYQQQWLG